MTDKPLFLVLGWDPSAEHAVRSMLASGMDVFVVGTKSRTGLPAGAERAAGVLVCLPAEEARGAIADLRRVNPGVRVVASRQREDLEAALLEAGAAKVIDARDEAAREMVRWMISERP